MDKGPYKQFSHSIEPHLRQLGLPTALEKGIVTLTKDHTICKEGDTLTPQQASILVKETKTFFCLNSFTKTFFCRNF